VYRDNKNRGVDIPPRLIAVETSQNRSFPTEQQKVTLLQAFFDDDAVLSAWRIFLPPRVR
jgi:hypothetical protein